MSIIKTAGDREREKSVFRFLNMMEEYDTDNKILESIITKFPDLEGCKFIRSEELMTGNIIRTVDLNLDKLSIPGIVTAIKQGLDGCIINVTLYNRYNNLFWKIIPSKYYIFILESAKIKQFRKLLKDLTKKLDT